MRLRTTAAAIALIAVAPACSPGQNTAEPAPSQTAKPTVKGTSQGPEPEPGPLSLGQPYHWNTTYPDVGRLSGSSTVLTYKQPITGIYPPDQDGEEWAQVEAKVCAKSGDVRVSQFPWSLAFADGTRVEVTGQTGGDFPRPEYPMDAAVKPGDCVKGKIMFPVRKGEQPDRVIYAPDDGDLSAEWVVPKG